MKMLFSQLKLPLQFPVTVYQDNTSAMCIAQSSAIKNRTKHIDVSCHHIRDHIIDGSIVLEHVSTSDMIADALTKPLVPSIFMKHREALTLAPVDISNQSDSASLTLSD